MKKLIYLFHCLTAACLMYCLFVSRAAAENLSSIVKRNFQELEQQGLPGINVAIQAHDQSPQRWFLGVADVTNNSPMHADLHFRAGSILKAIVGTAALQLVDEKRLSLDSPIDHYLDGIPNGDKIRVRMLGNHTSGFGDALANRSFRAQFNRDPRQQFSRQQILDAAFQDKITAPGKTYRYANTNTILLGAIIEKITGQSLHVILQEKIFMPLGIRHTYIPNDWRLTEPHARGYRHGKSENRIEYGDVFFDATDFNASWADAAGNIVTTLDDLLKLAKPIASGALLGPAQQQELTAWIDTGNADRSYGFALENYRGIHAHAGDVPGFSAYIGWLPKSNVSIVVLANLSNLASGDNPAALFGENILLELQRNSSEIKQ